jgi:serine/threonine protein kinase
LATLLLENGPDRGKGLELKPGESYTLGRDAGCQLVLHGELVSRHHVRVKEFKGSYYVKDLDSLNGVFLNDQRVAQAELKPGDKLQLGDNVLTFLDESLAKSKEEKTLGGYRLLERVGRGGMGTVYRAIQISLDREVALKVLSPDLVKDRAFVEQFFREARAAGQLNHPHIVSVYDVGQEGDAFYYSMEFVRGGSLEDRLRVEGKLPVPEVLRIALEAAMALEYAESRHIVHRDIKPDNLMLAEDGRVRVADLGLALSLKSSADHKGQPILGTPHFISPEQALRRDVDIRSDIYSLGATMYRMLAGRTLFQGTSAEEIVKKAVREEPQPLRELAPEVPEKVATLVHRMLKKEPAQRFASAKELRLELEKLTRHPGRTKALVAAIAVAFVAVVAAVVFALNKPEREIVTVESGDVQEARRRAFERESEANKRKIELEAVRAYMVLFESARPRETLRRDLDEWLKNYEYLDIPERGRASERARGIDEDVAKEKEAQKLAEQTRAAVLAAATASVEQPLERGELLVALLHADALDPAGEADAATSEQLAAERTRLLAAVRAKLQADRERRDAEIEAAAGAGRFDEAGAIAAAAEQAWTPPVDPLPASVSEEILSVRSAFAGKRADFQKRLVAEKEAVVTRDSARRADALGASTREAVLALELARAAELVEKAAAEAETSELRDELAPIAQALRRGDALLSTTLAALESGKLPADPPFRLAGSEKVSELAGFDREKRLVKLTTKARQGASSSTVPLAELANANSLRQLIVGSAPERPRVALDPDQSLALAELMTLVEVVRWAEGFAVLGARAAAYDPEAGWSDALRDGLPAPAEPQLAAEIALVLKELPAAQLADAARLRARALSEEQCQGELIAALDPFLKRESTIGWAASCQALRKLLEERRDTLLLRLVRPWLAGA